MSTARTERVLRERVSTERVHRENRVLKERTERAVLRDNSKIEREGERARARERRVLRELKEY